MVQSSFPQGGIDVKLIKEFIIRDEKGNGHSGAHILFYVFMHFQTDVPNNFSIECNEHFNRSFSVFDIEIFL